jgi:tetratricopeptide (TPR) repeat protein
MKRNELVDTVRQTVDYVSGHRRGVAEAVAVAVGIAALTAGFLLFRGWREGRAGAELSAGLEALAAPLAGEPAAKDAPRTFASEAERDREARRHLEKAVSFGGTEAGRAAALVLAARLGDTKEADAFGRAARERQADIATPGEIDAAKQLAAQGKMPEAIDRLRRAIDSSRTTAPRDALLFTLGELCERNGNTAEARAAYERIVNEFPDSPYRQDARSKAAAN